MSTSLAETSSLRPLWREPMAGADGFWLQDSPANLMVINSVMVLDRIDLETFRRLFLERVVAAGGRQRFPRFTRRVVRAGGRYYWEEDPDFEISRHIVPGPQEVRTPDQLRDYVSQQAEIPLPEDRSRWQVQVIEGFEDDSTVIVSRVHHCMGDGLALVPVLFTMMDEQERMEGLPGDRVAKRKPNRFALAAKLPFAGPAVLAQKMVWKADRSPVHGPDLGGRKRVAWTRKFDLTHVKELKNSFQATVNDVLMAGVAGAFRRYLDHSAGLGVERVRASMPVSIRAHGEPPEMNNRFAAVLLELPAGLADVRARIAETKRRMDALKRSVEPLVTYGLMRVMVKALPDGLSKRLADFLANKCTCVVTNVPGPQEDLYIGGSRMRNMIFWVPQRAKIGIGISIFSFSGHVQLGIISDTALLPDPQLFAEAFEQELEHMAEVAGKAG